MTTFFEAADVADLDTLRQAYRRLAMHYHPDKHEEAEVEYWTELFKELQAEYDSILQMINGETYEKARTSYRMEKDLQDMIEKAMRIPGVEVELCGVWLWISGDTFTQRLRLKMAGFKWSKKKKRWYWGLTMTAKGKKRAKYNSMADIYDKYGRVEIGVSEAKGPLLIG